MTFRRLIELSNSLDDEEKRATGEGLSGDELAMFDLLQKEGLDKSAREQVKRASKELLASIKARLKQLDRSWEKEQTKAGIEVFILDEVFASLPTPTVSRCASQSRTRSASMSTLRLAAMLSVRG